MPNIETNFASILHPNIICNEMFSQMIKILDESLSKWWYSQNCKFIIPKISCKECQITLGLHLVLVLLHKRFTFSIEQDK